MSSGEGGIEPYRDSQELCSVEVRKSVSKIFSKEAESSVASDEPAETVVKYTEVFSWGSDKYGQLG